MKKILTIGILLLFIGTTITPTTGVDSAKQSYVVTQDRSILYVGGSGSGNYSTIQDAIDDASDGDTVFVYDDSSPYYENVIVDKTIDLIGEDRNTTVIDINMSGEDGVYVSADWVNISGFHIRNAIVADAGIELHSNHSTITGNNFSMNKWVSIRTYDSNYNNISGNFFYQNKDSVQLWGSSNNIISGNYFTYNDYGIALLSSSHFNDISDNNLIGIFGRVNNDLIYVSSSNNNNVTNNIVSDCFYGIRTYGYTSYNNFSGNIISNCDRGMSLLRIRRSIVYDNRITNCDSYGLGIWDSEFNVISNNYISGNFGHGIYIEASFKSNTISSNTINSNEGHGIFLEASSFFNTIFDNNINSNGGHGFYLRSSRINTIFDNIINSNGGHGFYLKDSAHTNNIFENTISSNEGYGFYLKDFSNNNTISGNNVTSNTGHGFCLNDSSNDNTIIYNNVSTNDGYGIKIVNGSTPCKNNIMYHNNFVSNTFGGYDECDNIWDDGYPGGGNYWSDYTGIDDFRGPNQDIFGSDSIGDTTYGISGGDNEDSYPLMYPWGEQKPVANFTYSFENGGYILDGSSSYDRDGEIVLYEWDFGDGETGQGMVVLYGYNESGTYDVTLTVTDNDGYQGDYTLSIDAVKNYPTSAPLIDGPIEGKAGKSHFYNFTSEDPEGADVSYYVDWGDDRVEPWSDFISSGDTYRTAHGWSRGTYTIRCKSKDIYGAVSDWSELEVTMPKNQNMQFGWLERFPILNRLFNRFMERLSR